MTTQHPGEFHPQNASLPPWIALLPARLAEPDRKNATEHQKQTACQISRPRAVYL